MFRRLRERLAEELEAQATRFPGGQHAFNNSPGGRSMDSASKSQDENSSEDLITLSDSPSVVVPHTSPQQFSIGDDDGFPSETSTPQRTQANNSDTDQYYTPSSSEQQSATSLTEGQNILPTYTPSRRTYYVPQSDIESEVEEPPTLKLDVSMEQLCAANELLKAKLYKYKDKYAKVILAYKEVTEEKKKIEHTLTDCQDKALRRIAELKEQCQLEQKAKAHLEENLRIYLEEKEEMINVLQTKIVLLKEGRNTDAVEVPVPQTDTSEDSVKDENLSDQAEDETSVMKDKIKKLQVLLEKCKDTIVNNKEQIATLEKEKENLSQMIETKFKELDEIKERDSHTRSELEGQLQNLKSRLIELEQQQAESAMSMAETKKNMHEELEIKEQQLSKAKEDIQQLQHSVDEEKLATTEMKKQHDETIAKLQDKLKITEKLMEDEKQNLMQELSRGKAAAVTLMQQECEKKLHAVEAEWKEKLRECGAHNEKTLLDKEKEFNDAVAQKDIQLENMRYDLDKEKIIAEELERQNEKLSETILNVQDREACDEKNEATHSLTSMYEDELAKLKNKISALASEKEIFEKQAQASNSEKVEMEKKLVELQAEISSLLQENDEKCETFLSQINQLQYDISVLQETVRDKDNIILQLESATSILETDHQYSVEQMNETIKQLRVEREQLMLQAQERVTATEAKCRENTLSLNEKISELQSKETEIENLRLDIRKLSTQLDESLIVAEVNQSAAAQELSSLKARVNASQKELEECVKAHSAREAELANQVKSLRQEKMCFEVDSRNLEVLENEKRTLLQKVKSLKEKIERDSTILTEIQSLREENKALQSEVESLAALRKDNELLLSKVHSLASNEKDLHEKLNVLESTNVELRTSVPHSLQQSSQTDSSNVNKDVTQLQDENRALLDKISVLEETISQNTGNQFEKYTDLIKAEYEGKLKAKDVELESKLKQIIKDFAAQINVKEKDYDEILSQVMEQSQNQEGKLLREHRIELSSLRQEVFEKDCAMDEMHDHYEELMKVKKKEKDAKLMELEKKCSVMSSTKPGSDPTNACNDTSDWDDNWAECDENCEKSSPIHGGKGECASHVQQIRVLQEELERCNSELKDLKVLLRLTPPMSHASTNNSANSSLLLPEPTEFEYLKNILFEYMMGKEPLTLAKVIAAVLRFSDEQTKLVLRKEEMKQTAK